MSYNRTIILMMSTTLLSPLAVISGKTSGGNSQGWQLPMVKAIYAASAIHLQGKQDILDQIINIGNRRS